jgi:hypothetical protein
MVYPALLPLMRTTRLPVFVWTDAPPPNKIDSSVSPKDEIWFLLVCHHISNAVYLFSFQTKTLCLFFAGKKQLCSSWRLELPQCKVSQPHIYSTGPTRCCCYGELQLDEIHNIQYFFRLCLRIASSLQTLLAVFQVMSKKQYSSPRFKSCWMLSHVDW